MKRLPSGVLWGSAWKPRTTAALWLNRARQVVSWTMLSACLAWDLAYLVGGLPGNAAVTRAACQTRAYLPRFQIIVSGRLRQEVAYRCLLVGGEPALSAIAFVTKLSLALVCGVVAAATLGILLLIQPPSTVALPDVSPRLRPSWRAVGRACGVNSALILIPGLSAWYILWSTYPFDYGWNMSFVYTCEAAGMYFFVANSMTLVFLGRVDSARWRTDLPPQT